MSRGRSLEELYPCVGAKAPGPRTARTVADRKAAETGRPHEVYHCPDMHWHVREVKP